MANMYKEVIVDVLEYSTAYQSTDSSEIVMHKLLQTLPVKNVLL